MPNPKHVAGLESKPKSHTEELEHQIKELQSEQEDLRFHAQLLNSMRDSLVATDLEGTVTYWGPGAEALYQYRAEEVMDRSATIVVAPQQRKAIEERIHQVKQTGSWIGTYEQVRKDGSKFWGECVFSLVRDENGTPIGHISIDRDVTERVLMAEKIRECETTWQALDDHSLDMYASVDPETATVTRCNQTLATALACSKDEIVGQPVLDLYHPDSRDDAKKAFESFVATGEIRDSELQLQRKDGTRLDVSLNVTAVRDRHGKILQSRSCLRDITERKRAEEQMRQLAASLELRVEERTAALQEHVEKRRRAEGRAQEAELRYRTVADFTYDWEWWQSSDGTFRYVSPSSERVTGYKPSQFIDDPALLRRIILEEDLMNWDEHHRAALTETAQLEIQFRIQREDGEIRWIEHACQRVIDVNGDFQGFRASNRDITERKRAENRLRNALDELAKLKEQLEAENIYLKEAAELSGDAGEPVGNSPAWIRAVHRAHQVAPTVASVLLLGETGTGKSLMANLIHDHSERKERPLVSVNCAALPSSLIESELFGHEKGAFTGAGDRRIGRFEVANGGTLFLDEIGDLTPDVQVKLLRVLDQGEFERLGSTETLKANVRVIAATNRDIDRAVADGSFRQDLYYRLGVFPITLPPLRKRSEDVPLLAWFFVTKYRGILGKTIDRMPQETMDFLQSYDWPGNVRELENVIERAMILSGGNTLIIEEAGTALWPQKSVQSRPETTNLDQLERAHIVSVLEECGWKIKGDGNAADQLGLNPSTLFARMKKHGIKRPKKHA